jgi:hypothetical protein
MPLTILGEHPFVKGTDGGPVCRIATIFVRSATLVTLPGIHATQRAAYVLRLHEQRLAQGLPPLTDEETEQEWESAVDLIVEEDKFLIRPEPDRMALAFQADDLLQTIVSKCRIRFLFARHSAVQQGIRERGEYWRISSLPQSPEAIRDMIAGASIGIQRRPIYYYNMMSGTRYLTVQAFEALAGLSDEDLRLHLVEIQHYADRVNHFGSPELAFFAVTGGFGAGCFAGVDLASADAAALRRFHRDWVEQFRKAVPPELAVDAPDNLPWRNLMLSCLSGLPDDTVVEEVVQCMTPEFFRQIQWLPGARIEDGELVFDSIFDEVEQHPDDCALAGLCDDRVKGFICNYVREFGNLEYINIGHIAPSMRRRSKTGGHRAYIAEIKHRGSPQPIVRILRIQKWGIREHIDAGKDLLWAVMEAEEYTEYILDRRLGCWQLGMPVPSWISSRRLAETYHGPSQCYRGTRIWTTYFDRDYVPGIATDKIPAAWYRQEVFAVALARLLGRVAASNWIVGRTTLDGNVIFDDGDEILVLDSAGRPQEIVVADHVGMFTDCEPDLFRFATGYARPVMTRRGLVPDAVGFADAYVHALVHQLVHTQDEYRRHRRAFDTMFKHSKQDPGAFAWRWKQILKRLDNTDMRALGERVRDCLSRE